LKYDNFITLDTLSCLPGSDSPEPDFEDMRIMGFGPYPTLEEALKDILELSENQAGGRSGQTIRLDLRNDNRKYFHLKDFKTKARIAS
jgi:hypothetical protein